MFRRLSMSAALLTAMAAPALAHLNPEAHGAVMSGALTASSFMAGLSHPFSGADHMLAMVAVGLWAAQIGGRARWAVPAAFVAMMAMGFLISMGNVHLPFVEPGILASVIGLGLLVALAVRVPASLGALVVGLFALFHGHAHGGELGAATPLSFLLGFLLATMLLHAAGLMLGSTIASRSGHIARLLGLFTALGGAMLVWA